jgi:hypothetical protein
VKKNKITIKTYLFGPKKSCVNTYPIDWREWVKKHLKTSILDSLPSQYSIIKSNSKYNEVVNKDKQDILASDYILINFSKWSCRSAMVAAYGSFNNKKVIMVVPRSLDIDIWLYNHCYYICFSFQEAIDYIYNDIIRKNIYET